MWDTEASACLPDDFAGTVRLFPLPNLVMFPHVAQPLHIFEPRYRELLRDALATDQLIAMALLRPGWEADYDGRPSLYPTACIGRVTAHAEVDDGKFNIILTGVRRAAIVDELPPERAYRTAEVAVLEDLYPNAGKRQRAGLRTELLRCFRQFIPQSPAVLEQFETLTTSQVRLGVLADIIAFTIDFDLDFKQLLLAEWNVDTRAEMLVEQLGQLRNGSSGTFDKHEPFPPDFSDN